MAFTRIRTVKGRDYLYREERWREGGKVRSRSIYLGPTGVMIGTLSNPPPLPGSINMDEIARVDATRKAEAAGRFRAAVAELHHQFGLTVGPPNPVPIEKPATSLSGRAVLGERAGKEAASSGPEHATAGQEGSTASEENHEDQ